MLSIGDVLNCNRGIGPGFDTLRLLLSISILCWHSILVSYGIPADQAAWQGLLGLPASSLLPMFFALSGFLVMGSALRTNELGRFITLRALRIVPALATEITLSALLLGTAFTRLDFWDYVANPEFLAYFGSLIGRVRVSLPGVFETNAFPGVLNVSLWTISPELLCYVFIAVLMLTALFKQRSGMTILVAVLAVLCIANDSVRGTGIMLEARPSPKVLILSFAFGNLLYLWKDKIPYSSAVFGLSLAFGLLFVRTVGINYLALGALSYCIVYLGLTPLPKIPMLSRGDYSYGIYLYAFPMQQLVSHLAPGLREWYWNIALALPLTIMVAMASWTFVEKPALDLRKRLAPKKEKKPQQRSDVVNFVLLFSLLSYGLFLAWNADMILWTAATTERAIASFVALGAVVALMVSMMAVASRSWGKRAARAVTRARGVGKTRVYE